MERNRDGIILIFSFLVVLGLVSFALCIAAEFKRSKKKDIRLDGKLCYLPGSHAFGLGISALICLFIAQMIGNLIICTKFCVGRERGCSSCKPKNSTIATVFLSFSWISFVIAVMLIVAGTSMSRTQPFREGWLDGECYIVKDGVYVGSGILVLFTVGSTLLSAFMTLRNTKVDLGQKIHAQVE